MKLRQVRIRNFRCFRDEVAIDLSDFTVLIGKNDAGKSAVLQALALFFDEYKADGDDASINGDKTNMRITCEFDDLPESIVIDAQNATNLTAEHLLNSSGRLEIHQVFNGSLKSPKRTGIFAKAVHPVSSSYADLLYLKNAELKARAQELGVGLAGVDLRANAALRAAILGAAEDLHMKDTEVDLDREDAKNIWNALQRQLPIFAVFYSDRKSSDQDDEAQDPMKTAIAEALREMNSELDRVTSHVKDQVVEIARATVEKMREMDPALARELNPRLGQPNWASAFKVSLFDEDYIPVNKRGSGVRRLILLNFFRAKAEKRLQLDGAPGIIYAIEEPETGQHPNNQKLLMRAFRELSEQPGCQLVLTTHTPVLIRDVSLEDLRYIDASDVHRRRIRLGDEETYRDIARALGVIADHDVRVFIGVEGVNDIEFLKNIAKVLIDEGENVPDLTALEDGGELLFVPLGGSSLASWTHRLASLNRPEFHLFDRDEQPPVNSRHQSTADLMNARTGVTAVLTGKREMENYLHPDAIHDALGVRVAHSDFADIPDLVAAQLHALNAGQGNWSEVDKEVRRKKVSAAKRRLNSEAALAMTSSRLDEIDPDRDVRGWLATIQTMLAAE